MFSRFLSAPSDLRSPMFVECPCGARNSAFNPQCVKCGAVVVERGAAPSRPPPADRATPVGDARIAAREGDVVGGYVIEGILGIGSLGCVYRARAGDGARVALKILHPHVVAHEESRARFVREMQALENVDHPYVGKVFGAFEAGCVPALVMELYEGPSLRDVMCACRLDVIRAATLLLQLSQALDALHVAGWVHRDVKPENVLLVHPRGQEEIRLLDLGLARPVLGRVDGGLSTIGGFIGSPAYAAPEQLVGEAIGPWTDWWSLGVVAYEMLSGSRPFHGKTRSALAFSVLTKEPAPLDAPQPLARWVASLLSRDPANRPQRSADALAPLRRFLAAS